MSLVPAVLEAHFTRGIARQQTLVTTRHCKGKVQSKHERYATGGYSIYDCRSTLFANDSTYFTRYALADSRQKRRKAFVPPLATSLFIPGLFTVCPLL